MTIPQGIKRVICLFLAVCFIGQSTLTCYGQALVPVLIPPALNFSPPILKYLSVNSANPYNYFNFLLDKGSKPALANSGAGLEQEAKKLIHYFFIGLTLPESSLWVNLRPDEPGRITSLELAQTDMGKLLLEQDLRLKKDVAQYLNPSQPIGKRFWEELYAQAELLLGKGKLKKTAITTSNRVWIVPDEAVVMETEDGALVTQAKLKVLLESEYLSLKSKSWNKEVEVQIQNKDQLKNLTEALMKSIVIPEITKEVNSGQSYAPLRQIYHSLILAQWFKQKYRKQKKDAKDISYIEAIDQSWLKGLESEFPWSKDAIWKEYLASFQKGEYQLKEKLAGLNRMYTSGGIEFFNGQGSSPLQIIAYNGNGVISPMANPSVGRDNTALAVTRVSSGKQDSAGGATDKWLPDNIRTVELNGGKGQLPSSRLEAEADVYSEKNVKEVVSAASPLEEKRDVIPSSSTGHLNNLARVVTPVQAVREIDIRNLVGVIDSSNEIVQVVESLGRQALHNFGLPEQQYAFVVADSDTVNAAFYDKEEERVIEVTWGLLQFLRRNSLLDQDTIAFIIGHEVGHSLNQEHEKQDNNLRYSTLTHEYRADEHGLAAANLQHLTPLAGMRLMEALRREQRTAQITITHLQTHRRQVKIYNDIRHGYWSNLYAETKRIPDSALEIRRSSRFYFDEGLYQSLSLANLERMVALATSPHDILKLVHLFTILFGYRSILAELANPTGTGVALDIAKGQVEGLLTGSVGLIRAELAERYLHDEGIDPQRYVTTAQVDQIRNWANEIARNQQITVTEDVLHNLILQMLALGIERNVRTMQQAYTKNRRRLSPYAQYRPQALENGDEPGPQFPTAFWQRQVELYRVEFGLFQQMLTDKLLELVLELRSLTAHDQRQLILYGFLGGLRYLDIPQIPQGQRIFSYLDELTWDDPVAVLTIMLTQFHEFENDYLQTRDNQRWMRQIQNIESRMILSSGGTDTFYNLYTHELISGMLEAIRQRVNQLNLASLVPLYQAYLAHRYVLPKVVDLNYMQEQKYGAQLLDLVYRKISGLSDFQTLFEAVSDSIGQEFDQRGPLRDRLFDWIANANSEQELFNGLDFMLGEPRLRNQAIGALDRFMAKAVRAFGIGPEAVIQKLDDILRRHRLEEEWVDPNYNIGMQRSGWPNAFARAYAVLIAKISETEKRKELIGVYYRRFNHRLDIDFSDPKKTKFYPDGPLMKLLRNTLDQEGMSLGDQLVYFFEQGFLPDDALVGAVQNQDDRERLFQILVDHEQAFRNSRVHEEEYNELVSGLAWDWFFPAEHMPQYTTTHTRQIASGNALVSQTSVIEQRPVVTLRDFVKRLRPSSLNTWKFKNFLNRFDLNHVSDRDFEILLQLSARLVSRGLQIPNLGISAVKYKEFNDSVNPSRQAYRQEISGYLPVWARGKEDSARDFTLEWGDWLLQLWLARHSNASPAERIAVVLLAYPVKSSYRNKILIDLIGDPLRSPSLNFEAVFPYLADSDIKEILAKRILTEKRQAGALALTTYKDVKTLIEAYFPADSAVGRELLQEFLQDAEVSLGELRSYQEENAVDQVSRDWRKRDGHHLLELMADDLESHAPQDKRELFEWLAGLIANKPTIVQYYEYRYKVDLSDLAALLALGSAVERYLFVTTLFIGPTGILSDDSQRRQVVETIFRVGTGEVPEQDNTLFLIYREMVEASPELKQLDLMYGAFNYFVIHGRNGRGTREQLISTTLSSFGFVGVKVGQFLGIEGLSDEVEPLDKRYLLNALLFDHGFEALQQNIAVIGRLLGSASIKQGYVVRKQDGSSLAFKYVRPLAKYEIQENMDILRLVLGRLRGKVSEVDQISDKLLHEVEKAVKGELDIANEMANQRFIGKFSDGAHLNGWKLSIPKIDDQLQGALFFADELLQGRHPKNDVQEELRKAGHLKEVIKLIFHVLLRQILILGRYHADLNRGNIKVDEASQAVGLLDFGNVATLSQENQSHFIMLLVSLQYGRMAWALSVLQRMAGVDAWNQDIEADLKRVLAASELSIDAKLRQIKAILDQRNISFKGEFEVLFKVFDAIQYLTKELAPEETAEAFSNVIRERQFHSFGNLVSVTTLRLVFEYIKGVVQGRLGMPQLPSILPSPTPADQSAALTVDDRDAPSRSLEEQDMSASLPVKQQSGSNISAADGHSSSPVVNEDGKIVPSPAERRDSSVASPLANEDEKREQDFFDALYKNVITERFLRSYVFRKMNGEFTEEDARQWLQGLSILSAQQVSSTNSGRYQVRLYKVSWHVGNFDRRAYVILRTEDDHIVFSAISGENSFNDVPLFDGRVFYQFPSSVAGLVGQYLLKSEITIEPEKEKPIWFVKSSWIEGEEDKISFESALRANPIIRDFLMWWMGSVPDVRLAGEIIVHMGGGGAGYYNNGIYRNRYTIGPGDLNSFVHEFIHHLFHKRLSAEQRVEIERYFREHHPEYVMAVFRQGGMYEGLEDAGYTYANEALAYYLSMALSGRRLDTGWGYKDEALILKDGDLEFFVSLGLLPEFLKERIVDTLKTKEIESKSATSLEKNQAESAASPLEREGNDASLEVRERQEARRKLDDLLRTSNKVDINVIKQMDANGSLYEAIPELRVLLEKSKDPGHTAERRIDHVFDALEFFESLIENVPNAALDDQGNKIIEDLVGIRKKIAQDKNALYLLRLAILLHDVGKRPEKKPLEHSHEERGAADVLPLILERIENLTEEDKKTISYLVEHHSAFSFFGNKRDSSEEAKDNLVVEAADVLGDDLKRIEMLYLLNVADFVALDIKDKKNSSRGLLVLAIPFKFIRDALLKKGDLERARKKVEEEFLRVILSGHREERKKLYLGLMGLRLIAGAGYKQMQDYLSVFEAVLQGETSVKTSKLLYYDNTQYTELVVGVPKDGLGLLRVIAGLLVDEGYDIHLAWINTVDVDGKKIVFDRFLIKRVSGQSDDGLEQELVDKIKAFLDAGVAETDMDAIKQRLPELTSSNVKINFEKNSDGKVTQMTIKTKDVRGLLFRITDVLSESGINLRKAIIKTRGSDVGNIFFIEDENGNPLDEASANKLRVKLEIELTAPEHSSSSPLRDDMGDIGLVRTLKDLARFIVIRHKTGSLTPHIIQRAHVEFSAIYRELTGKGLSSFEEGEDPEKKDEVFRKFLEEVRRIEDEESIDASDQDSPSSWIAEEFVLAGDVSELDKGESPVAYDVIGMGSKITDERKALTDLQNELKQKLIRKANLQEIIETIKEMKKIDLDAYNVPPKVVTFTVDDKQYLKELVKDGNELVNYIYYFSHRRDSLINGIGFPVTDENRNIFIADLRRINADSKGVMGLKDDSGQKVEIYSHSDLERTSIDDLIDGLSKKTVARIDIRYIPLSKVIRIEYVKSEVGSIPTLVQSSSPVAVNEDSEEPVGGIDLSQIEVTLKDDKFVSQLNPADLKVLRAAKYLKEGWGSLSLLYVYEVMLLLKDNLANDIKQKGLLQEVMKQLQVKGFIVPEIRLALAS